MAIRAVVITVSDKGYAGLREDASGPVLAEALRAIGASIVAQTIVPDEREQIGGQDLAVVAAMSHQVHLDLSGHGSHLAVVSLLRSAAGQAARHRP